MTILIIFAIDDSHTMNLHNNIMLIYMLRTIETPAISYWKSPRFMHEKGFRQRKDWPFISLLWEMRYLKIFFMKIYCIKNII